MNHYTEKFKEAYDRAMSKPTHEEKQLAFRDEMLKLGHEERIKNLYRVQDKLTKDALFFKQNEPQTRYLTVKKNQKIKADSFLFIVLLVLISSFAYWDL